MKTKVVNVAKSIKKLKRGSRAKSASSDLHRIPVSILDELASRFIINVPLKEKYDMIRVCFQMELAYWFFIDFYVPQNPNLQDGTIQEFTCHMFNHIPYLKEYSDDVEEILEHWQIYKMSIPVNGAILLNKKMNKVLLVQGFGNKGNWAFPKGKVNQEEDHASCAIREVYEETGYDVSHLIDDNLYLEKVHNNQTVRLFLVAGVEEDFNFQPRVRGEVRDIRWWNVMDLPTSLAEKETKTRLGVNVNQFYNAIPFIEDLRDWVTSLCVNKASWKILEPTGDGRTDNCVSHTKNFESAYHVKKVERGNMKVKIYTESDSDETDGEDSYEVFCPKSWMNFSFKALAQELRAILENSSLN